MQIINVCPLPREHGLHTFKRAYPCPSSMLEARDVKLSYLHTFKWAYPCPSSMIEARDVKLSYLTIIQYKRPS
jgi:hypothetical protein